jgi:hypothetical protein
MSLLHTKKEQNNAVALFPCSSEGLAKKREYYLLKK